VFTVDTALITLASVVGTVAAIVVWRRLFPSPMPAWFDPINTWYRNRAFPPPVALAQFSVASGRRVLELWRACWVSCPIGSRHSARSAEFQYTQRFLRPAA